MADIITFPWIRIATQHSSRFDDRGYLDLADYPGVKRWYDEIEARPAVQRGLAVLSDASGRARSPTTSARSRSARPSSRRADR